MKKLIKSISNSFIQEAISSPRMLEDLASMEKYMSESYDGRTFVELIQNADDACASAVKVFCCGDTLIVANSGRPFNKDDLMAICRSGSSNKQRGTSIGYRGVGFKSATTISNEIVISSADAFFTFSKALCSKALGKDPSKVPTVRIPFPYEEAELPREVFAAVRRAAEDGYTTFFIFLQANISKFSSELAGFGSGWLLFLNNVCKIAIDLPAIRKQCSVIRKATPNGDRIIVIPETSEQWYVTSTDDVSLAFQYDDNGIKPCAAHDACFHCYLPTLDKIGYPFKVNADFSTDPSRKHLIWDDITKHAFEKAECLFVEFIARALATTDRKMCTALSLISTPIALSELAARFENGLFQRLRTTAWVPLNTGKTVTPDEAYLLPNVFSSEELELLVTHSELISVKLPYLWVFQNVEKLDVILTRAGSKEVTVRMLSEVLKQPNAVSQISEELVGKIFVHSCRSDLATRGIIDNILIPLHDGSNIRLGEVSGADNISPTFLNALKAMSIREKNLLVENYPAFTCILKAPSLQSTSRGRITLSRSKTTDSGTEMAISKWKTPMQNCISLETLQGNVAKSAEKGCAEYDVISTSPDGSIAYIATKNVGVLGDSFSLSESEYAAAVRYGDNYKVYLFTTATSNVKYEVIKNPANTLAMQKVVKEWEWLCGENTSDVTNGGSKKLPDDLDRKKDFVTNFDDMNGVQFEEFCAQLLIKSGYEDVTLTPGSGDQGIDIIAYRDGIKFGIQCKCYSSDLGNGAVQEAFSGKTFYKCHIGIVLTNRHFSNAAIELAETNGIILWGREILLRMIKKAGLYE